MVGKQRGITLLGFAVVLSVLGFFAYAAMKLVPVYTEHMGIVKSMRKLQTEAGIENKSIDEIRRDLNVQFDIQYVDESVVPPANIQLRKQNGASSLRIFYDKKVPFVYNISLLVSFDDTVDLSHGATY